METVELPLLRFRDGDDDDYFERPATFLGHITQVSEDCLTITQGPNLSTQLYLEDLEVLFDDDEDLTFTVMLDAREHNDLVKIQLLPDRLTYANEAQAKRHA